MTAIAFIDFSGLPKTNLTESDFQEKLKHNTVFAGSMSKRSCVQPCPGTTPNAACTAQEGQTGGESWFCVPTGKCPKEDVDETTGPDPEHLAQQNYSLRSFRDNYLLNSSGGRQFVNLYYGLNVPKGNLTIPFCLETLELVDRVIPLLADLEKNPNSNTILIDSSTKDKLIEYLKEVKLLYNDSSSKSKIDDIIIHVNVLSNRSNVYITHYLENM
jgi:hypothetical protein